MTDPLEKVLVAESAARARIEKARSTFESKLRAARTDATRIKERNEQRTRTAVDRAERKCAEAASRDIDKLEKETGRQLSLDDATVEARLDALVQQRVDQLWPG